MFCRRGFVKFNGGKNLELCGNVIERKLQFSLSPVIAHFLVHGIKASSLESYFIFYKHTVLKRVSKMLFCKYLVSF